MSRRTKKRRRTSLLVLLGVAAGVLTAAVLWRWRAPPPVLPETDSTGALHSTPPAGTAPAGQAAHEEFSATERQRLDDILRRKNMSAPR